MPMKNTCLAQRIQWSLLLFALVPAPSSAQDFVIVTELRRFYSVTISGCEVQYMSTIQPISVNFTDITYTPDGQLWGISADGSLYHADPVSGLTDFQGSIPFGGFYTSLVADENGLIYTVGASGDLYTFNPGDNSFEYLGNVGYGSAGDLTFVSGQLVMAATTNQMVAINLQDPSNSYPLLNFSVGGSIYGIVTFAETCDNTVTYASNDSGLGTIYEIDFEAEQLMPVCDVNQIIYGAASEQEFLAAAPIEVGNIEVSGTTCADPAGSILVEASGGNGGLFYSLDNENFQGSGFFSGLSPGLYTVFIIDDFGCTAEVEAEVLSLDEPPSLVNAAAFPATCGLSNGQILLEAEGGSLPYQYSINGGSTFVSSPFFQSLPPGEYTAVVQDAEGCTDEVALLLTGSGVPAVSEVSFDLCSLPATAQAQITVTGGAAPYQFTLGGLPAQGNGVFSDLPPGSYELMVADATGCTLDTVIVVPEPSPVILAGLSVEPVSCLQPLGSAVVSLASPAVGAVFQLNGGEPTENPVFAGLPAADYNLLIFSPAGCVLDTSFSVPDLNNGPQVAEVGITNTSCGEENGAIALTVSNGQAPYTFQLQGQPAQPSGVFAGLPEGVYELAVTDAQGCTVEAAAAVGGSEALALEAEVQACGPGRSIVALLAAGGSGAGLSFSADGGPAQSAPVFSGLSPGIFQFTATDSDGCLAALEVGVPDAEALVLSLDFARGCGPGESSLQVSGSGGAGPLSFELNGALGRNNGRFDSLSAGVFQLTVSDSVGCVSEVLEVEVPGAEPLRMAILPLQPSRCGKPDGELQIEVSGGAAPYRYFLGDQEQNSSRWEGLVSGAYVLQVVDAEGCIRTAEGMVLGECPVFVPGAFSPNDDGRNDRFELFSGLPFWVATYRIYDRWGGLLYEANGFDGLADRQRYWDGVSAGEPAPVGLYTYQIEVIRGDGRAEQLEGGVQLAR